MLREPQTQKFYYSCMPHCKATLGCTRKPQTCKLIVLRELPTRNTKGLLLLLLLNYYVKDIIILFY